MTDGVLEGPPLDLDILPWQTLLPLMEPEEMLRSLNTEQEEEDDLTRFLEIMNPTYVCPLPSARLESREEQSKAEISYK
jgi:hypothetical protein